MYGATKLAGETAVLAALPAATVVRTSWVYTGGSGNDFAAVMAAKARAGARVDVVDDQIGTPTYVGDLVAALLQIADHPVSAPIVHAANTGVGSRFDQARAVYAVVGADQDLVRPVSSAAAPTSSRQTRLFGAGRPAVGGRRTGTVAVLAAGAGSGAIGFVKRGPLPSTP